MGRSTRNSTCRRVRLASFPGMAESIKLANAVKGLESVSKAFSKGGGDHRGGFTVEVRLETQRFGVSGVFVYPLN